MDFARERAKSNKGYFQILKKHCKFNWAQLEVNINKQDHWSLKEPINFYLIETSSLVCIV